MDKAVFCFFFYFLISDALFFLKDENLYRLLTLLGVKIEKDRFPNP